MAEDDLLKNLKETEAKQKPVTHLNMVYLLVLHSWDISYWIEMGVPDRDQFTNGCQRTGTLCSGVSLVALKTMIPLK